MGPIYSKSAYVMNVHGLRFFVNQCPNQDYRAEGIACLKNAKQDYLINLIPQDHPDRIGLFRWLTTDAVSGD